MPGRGCLAFAAGCALFLSLTTGALCASRARAADPTPPPVDPPAVTLPAAPDPPPDPSPPPPPAPASKPALSTHKATVSPAPSARAAQPAGLPPAPTQKRTQPGRPTLRPRIGRPRHRHRLHVKRPQAVLDRRPASAPQIRRPTHERLAVGRLQPLAARSDASTSGGARTPLFVATATLLLGVFGLFVLRMLSPQLAAATQFPRRSRHPARAAPRQTPRQTPPQRTPARPAAHARPAPPSVPPQRAAKEPRRALAPEKAGRSRELPRGNAPPTRPEQPLATTCEIRVFRGYVKAQFYAEVRPADGKAPYASGTSQWFRSRGVDAPTAEPGIVAARDQLLDVLAADGWVRVGQGAEWYSDRLERRIRTR